MLQKILFVIAVRVTIIYIVSKKVSKYERNWEMVLNET